MTDVSAREFGILGPLEVRADAWDTAVRDGARRSFEDAIAYALEQESGPSHQASTT